jgi:hypothetical protein
VRRDFGQLTGGFVRTEPFRSRAAIGDPAVAARAPSGLRLPRRPACLALIGSLAAIAFLSAAAAPASATIQYDRQFAGSLTNGFLTLPSRVAVDSSGNAYITDTGNNRVQEFDSSNNFVRKWGSVGTGNSQFTAPQGIAIDSSGNVYVVDTGNNRVQKFNSSGTFLTKWGAVGTNPGQFTAPQGIAIDSSDNVYVADTGNNRVQEFDSSGTFIRAFGSAGTGDGQLATPSAVAISSDGNVYVADSGNSRIQEFDSSRSFIRKWGSVGTGDGQFGPTTTPSLDLAIGSSDNVVVVDPTNNRVEKFRPIGTFITKWGTLGIGNGQFTTPAGVAISASDSVFVVDRGLINGRVEVFHETDTTDPDTSLDSGPSGVSNGDVSFAFSSAEPQLLAPGFECRLDTTEWEACGSPNAYTNLSEGSHTFRVRAVDAAGNPDPSPSVRTWSVDRTPPQTTLDSGPSGPTNDPSPSFDFSSSEAGSSFQCRLDSNQPSDWQTCNSPKSPGTLSDGAHTFDVRAIDGVGNIDPTPASTSFTVDTADPQTTLDSGPSGSSNNASPSFAFSSSEDSTFQCRLDSNQPSDWESCTSPKSYGTISDGGHTFEVRATDSAQNTDPTPASRGFTIDTQAPAAPHIGATDPKSPANQNAPKVKGTAEAGSKVRLYKTAGCTGTPAAVGSAAKFASPGLTGSVANNTTTAFRATSEDAAGNLSPCSAPRTYVEDSKRPDRPQITATDPSSPANQNAPKLKGIAEAGSRVRIYKTADCTGSPVTQGSAAKFASPGLVASVPDNSNTSFRATARDAAGNTSPCSAARTYTEDSRAPGAPAIKVVNPVSPANYNQPRLKGFAAAPSVVSIYETPGCTGAPVASGAATQFQSEGLVVSVPDDTTTSFRATATDPAGNRSQCSASFSYVEDSTPPKTSIVFEPPSTTTNRRPTFRFQSNEPGSTFRCRFDAKPFGRCSGPGASHRPYVALSLGEHTFEVVATDKAQNTDPTPSHRTFTVVP